MPNGRPRIACAGFPWIPRPCPSDRPAGRPTTVTVGLFLLLFNGLAIDGARPVAAQEPPPAGEEEAPPAVPPPMAPDDDTPPPFETEVTVTAPSLQAERLVEAPAAVDTLSPREIERGALAGALPLALATVPGVELTQNGIWDFNLNLRGFNSSLNRRVALRIDGRDPSVPLLGSLEWAALSGMTAEFASVELVHGPASALYGANAFGGVVSIRTKTPEESAGGAIRLGGGERDSREATVRWAGEVAGGWWVKLVGGGSASDGFSRSRHETVEYPGLRLERLPLERDDAETRFADLRVDKVFDGNLRLSLEAGQTDIEGVVQVAGAGRVQQAETERPWARVSLGNDHWQLLGSWNRRKAEDQLAMNSGARLWEDSDNLNLEGRLSETFLGGRLRALAGGSYTNESVDTAGATGGQTLLWSSIDADRRALFAQADYDLTSGLTVAASARWDDSSLFDDEFSPQVALLWKITPTATARLAWRRGYQTPNYSELDLWVPVAPPADLSAIEAALAPWLDGQEIGLSSVPRVAAGNRGLSPETVEGWEVGFAGLVADRVFLTFEGYRSTVDNFVTDLLPQVSAAGRLNPLWGPYVPTVDLPQEALDILAAMAPPNLTNAPDGSPSLVLLSYANYGRVDISGATLGAKANLATHLTAAVHGSWFDFDVDEQLAGDRLLPNAPEWQWGASVAWEDERFDASLSWQHVEAFDWAAGSFVGPVPAFDTVSVAAQARLGGGWSVGVAVTNLLDEEHYESFGGDLLRRRAMGWLGWAW